MEIKEIKAKNFRGYTDFLMNPEKIQAIVGSTGAGKSSITKMIESTLSYSSKKDVTLKKEGADKMEVETTLSDGTKIKLEQRLKGTRIGTDAYLNGRKTTFDGIQKELEANFGVNKDAIIKAISISELMGLNNASLGEFLIKYIPEKLDISKIKSFCSTLTPEMEEELEARFPMFPEKFDLDYVNLVKADLTEERKATKKKLTTLKGQIKEEVPNPIIKESDMRRGLEDTLKTLGEIRVQKKLVEKWEEDKRKQEKIADEIQELKLEISNIKVSKPKKQVLQDLQDNLSSLLQEKISIEKFIATIEKDISMFEKTLKNLEKSTCPLSDKLVCKTDKTLLKKELEDLVQSNKEGLMYQKDLLEKISEKEKEIRKAMEKYFEQEELYNKKLILVSKQDALSKQIVTLGKKPSIDDEDLQLKNKERYEGYLKDIEKYKAYKEIEEAVKKVGKRVELLEALCKLVSSNGEITKGINSHYVGLFNKILKDRATLLGTDISLNMIADKGIDLEIISRGNTIKLSDASSGEKAIGYFLLSDLLNQLSGVKIMILDDVDKLDDKVFEKLIKFIKRKEVTDFYDHIFILGINHTDTVKVLNDNKINTIEVDCH